MRFLAINMFRVIIRDREHVWYNKLTFEVSKYELCFASIINMQNNTRFQNFWSLFLTFCSNSFPVESYLRNIFMYQVEIFCYFHFFSSAHKSGLYIYMHCSVT